MDDYIHTSAKKKSSVQLKRRNKMKYISMNLARTYIPEWGLEEVVREVGANYIDAGKHKIQATPNMLVFLSETDPGIDQLLVMGVSTSREKNEAIGNFGEGNKAAALVATRRKNTSMIIDSPRGRITFMFKKPAHFDTAVLHACIDPTKKSDIFKTTITALGVHDSYKKMFLDSETRLLTRIEKEAAQEHTRIYCKGVYITTLKEMKSKYHWNLNQLKLNRDRSIPDMYSVESNLRYWLEDNMTKELATEMLENPGTVEAKVIGQCSWLKDSTKDILAAAFNDKYGNTAVIQSNKSYTNQRARSKGFNPVRIPDILENAFRTLGIETADEKVTMSDTFKEVFDNNPEYIAEMEKLMDILEVPAEIRVFEDRGDGTLGHAVYSIDKRMTEVWINKRLMRPGTRQKRIMTACHELGHIEGMAGDETAEFEYSLSSIAGKLATKLLDKMQAKFV